MALFKQISTCKYLLLMFVLNYQNYQRVGFTTEGKTMIITEFRLKILKSIVLMCSSSPVWFTWCLVLTGVQLIWGLNRSKLEATAIILNTSLILRDKTSTWDFAGLQKVLYWHFLHYAISRGATVRAEQRTHLSHSYRPFFTGDILACQSMNSTDVTNNINNGSAPLNCPSKSWQCPNMQEDRERTGGW